MVIHVDCKSTTTFYANTMLLTSSQVSVLITCAIVLLCTSALFISGCLVQQRTLRELRTAIRPRVVTRPKPKVWDIEALKRTKTTVRLEDGTMVEIQNPHAEVAVDPLSQPQDGETIEVRLTPPDVDEPAQKPLTPSEEDDGDDDSTLNVKGSWDGVQEGGEALSRVERRKRIKAEIQRLSRGDAPVYYQRRLW
ncbi:hypothetical protein F4782DRAFT_384457 [Xylaria castorea]|nr:hypothetical protein F4782DRAFT_384457 [Xylaria castorea]